MSALMNLLHLCLVLFHLCLVSFHLCLVSFQRIARTRVSALHQNVASSQCVHVSPLHMLIFCSTVHLTLFGCVLCCFAVHS